MPKTHGDAKQSRASIAHDTLIVIKTDAKGIITYVNDAFVDVSGYDRDELIGKNHNIDRHPDVPLQVYEDLWRTIEAGYPWRGMLKSRAKNGDHYWSDTFVAPIRVTDETIGYISVRSAPTLRSVANAEASYRKLRESNSKINSCSSWWKRISIRAWLAAIMLFMCGLLTVGATVGVFGIMQSNAALEDLYHQQLEPIEMIGRITELLADNRAQAMFSLQHHERSPFSSMHNHSLSMHTDAIARNREEIEGLVAELQARKYPAEITSQLDTYRMARDVFEKEGLEPAYQALLNVNYDEASRILLLRTTPAYLDAAAAAKKVQQAMKSNALASYTAAEQRHSLFLRIAIGGTIMAFILVAFVTWKLSRAIVLPLNRIIGHFERMSQGNLSEDIDISGRDETGRVLTHLATMQANLKVLVNEIQIAAITIEREAGRVDWQTANVVDQSEQQRDRSASIAAATEEFSHSVREVADSANQAAEEALNAQTQVTEAQVSMNESTAATCRVVEAVQASSVTITHLNQSIGKIGDISQTIKEIADQTNLLALNAAIEAARAGEAGRGFAVVADEVRKLAERTSGSTADITAIIGEIRHVTDAAVDSMGRAVVEVEQGIGKINESTIGLTRITKTSREVTDMAHHIAEAASEQAIASEQVAGNMERIANLIDGNLEAAMEAKEAAGSLRISVNALRQVAGQFKVARRNGSSPVNP